jgi:hypothetical protein
VKLLAAQAIWLVLVGLVGLVPQLLRSNGDVRLYHEVGAKIAAGLIPYVQIQSEYPPLAMLPFALPSLLPSATDVSLQTYAWRFLVQNALLATAVGYGLALITHRFMPERSAVRVLLAYLAFAIVLAPLIDWRFDIFPAALSLLALGLLLAGRPLPSGVALAASVLAKLYALPIGALFVAWYVARGEYRRAGEFGVATAAVGGLAVAPFVLLGDKLNTVFLRQQLDRGIQLESVYSGLIGLAHLATGLPARATVGFGAMQVESSWTAASLTISGVVLPLMVGAVVTLGLLRFIELWRAVDHIPAQTLISYTAATLLAIIVTSKVLSPQYMVWLLPFAPLLARGPRLVLLVAAILTVANYSFLYEPLTRFEPISIVMLNLRNVALVASFGWLLVSERPHGWAWVGRRDTRVPPASSRASETGE